MGLEGGVEALEEGVNVVGPAGGEVGHDAQDEDADDEHVGLAAAVAYGVTAGFNNKTECITVYIPRSNFIHIVIL